MTRLSIVAALLASTALSACTLAPAYVRPAPPVPQAFPTTAPTQGSAADLAWKQVFQDAKLQKLIDLSLTENRDLRVAIGNIEQARAQYRVQRANLFPAVDAGLSESRVHTPRSVSGTGSSIDSDTYTASAGVSYELDLFGRVRSLNAVALQNFFAVEENRRAAQVTLVAEVATDYLVLASDTDQLKLARDTLAAREASLGISQKRFDAGAASRLDLSSAQTLTEQSRADVAAAVALVAQDRNALRLVVGADIPAELEPTDGLAGISVLAELPAGLPSKVLTKRPDVLAAEHSLEAQNANIGAARAAFFPRISLTGAGGSASGDLGGLFKGGSGLWSFAPQITVPIFSGGANVANLKSAKAGRDIAVATYEKSIQTAFREVADALAVQSTIDERLTAQQNLVGAAQTTQRLTQTRYENGVDSYLNALDAQRTLYAARQGLLTTQLIALVNRVTLYKALGGGA